MPDEYDQGLIDADGDEPTPEALDELAALAEAETAASRAAAEAAAVATRELDAERARTGAALARYRQAVLAAEPELPPDLVHGDTLEALDASLAAARRAVAQIRERLAAEAEQTRGFPAGAPARGAASTAGLTPEEKIAYGLSQRA